MQSATDPDDLRYKVAASTYPSLGHVTACMGEHRSYMRKSCVKALADPGRALHAADAGVLQHFIDFDIYK